MNKFYDYKRPPVSLLYDYGNNYASAGEVESNKQMIIAALKEVGLNAYIDMVDVAATFSEYIVGFLNEAGEHFNLSYVDECIPRRELIKTCKLFNRENIIADCDFCSKKLVVSIPNLRPTVLGLRDLLNGAVNGDFNYKLLGFKAGKDIYGKDVFCSLAYDSQNYVVVGKNVEERNNCIRSILTNFLYTFSPKGMRFIFINLNGNVLNLFAHIPHLLIDEIIDKPDRIMKAVSWVIDEMKRRMQLLEKGIDGKIACNEVVYNGLIEDDKKLPEIVIIIDGFLNPDFPYIKELEKRLDRLVNLPYVWGMKNEILCPHTGIHLIFSVQNWSEHPFRFISHRLVFKTATQVESRVYLRGFKGAENLTGHNDMYMYPTINGKLLHAQGCYISEEEVKTVVKFVIENNEPDFDDNVKNYLDTCDIGDCSGITSINFSGTMAEWRRTGFGGSRLDKGRLVVHCSDGDITY